jgi:hypothetical protein
MKRIPSYEFRKTYRHLTERTAVTVYGKTIGTWVPTSPKKVDKSDKLDTQVEHKEDK